MIKGAKGTLKGFVWFQSKSNSFTEWNRANYLHDLTKLIADEQQEIYDAFVSNDIFSSSGEVPIVICELSKWIYENERKRKKIKNI